MSDKKIVYNPYDREILLVKNLGDPSKKPYIATLYDEFKPQSRSHLDIERMISGTNYYHAIVHSEGFNKVSESEIKRYNEIRDEILLHLNAWSTFSRLTRRVNRNIAPYVRVASWFFEGTQLFKEDVDRVLGSRKHVCSLVKNYEATFHPGALAQCKKTKKIISILSPVQYPAKLVQDKIPLVYVIEEGSGIVTHEIKNLKLVQGVKNV